MKRALDIATWNRKDHYHFFKGFEEPFFGATVSIDCTKAYTTAKESGVSFFLYYLYQSLAAANAVEPFKYRIKDDEVFVWDVVNASPTINRSDGSFGFAYMDYQEDKDLFYAAAQKEIERVQSTTGLVPAFSGENVIHYSSIPWLAFTSLSHARAFSFKDSIPKISFGKMMGEKGFRKLPVSVHVHHALMYGFHVAQFVDLFQQLMNKG
jgi:chloramphenicol O-acetyltransferase type A